MLKSLILRREGGISKEKTAGTAGTVVFGTLTVAAALGLIGAGESQSVSEAVQGHVEQGLGALELLVLSLIGLFNEVRGLWARNRVEKS